MTPKLDMLIQTGWITFYTCSRTWERPDGRILMVLINPPMYPISSTWNVMAIETSIDVHRVLEDHMHHDIGSYVEEKDAKAAGESYAEMWLKHATAASTEACSCEEIPSGVSEP